MLLQQRSKPHGASDNKRKHAQMGVTDVVRLNVRENNEYAPSQFTRHGFVHHDLIFDDCTTPPDYISQRFLGEQNALMSHATYSSVHR